MHSSLPQVKCSRVGHPSDWKHCKADWFLVQKWISKYQTLLCNQPQCRQLASGERAASAPESDGFRLVPLSHEVTLVS
jgi:hypothetical protein